MVTFASLLSGRTDTGHDTRRRVLEEAEAVAGTVATILASGLGLKESVFRSEFRLRLPRHASSIRLSHSRCNLLEVSESERP